MPSLPSLKSPPSGMTHHTRNAGTNARYGASLNTKRSLCSGIRSSLKNSLMPSASVCSRPNGPALFGADAVLHAGDDLALEPHHQHRADEADDEDDDDLDEDDEDVAEVEIADRGADRARASEVLDSDVVDRGEAVDELADVAARAG